VDDEPRVHGQGAPAEVFPPAAAWWSDAQGGLVALSPRWEELTGRSIEKECGTGWLAGVHPDDVGAWLEALAQAVRGEGELRVDLRVRGPAAASLWLRMHGRPRRDAAGALLGFTGSATDVSDLRAAQEELLAELRRQPRQVPLEPLDRLVEVGVHDLQAPLRNLQYLLDQLDDRLVDAEAQQILRDARRLVCAAQDVARSVLDYAQLDRHGPRAESVDARQALDWALDQLRPLIERTGARIEVSGMPRVCADPIQLGRIFQNLVSNALLHAGPHAPRVEIHAHREADQIVFAVRDQGIGIPSAQHAAIFELFHRLQNSDVPGTGAGLAICRKLVELHGGRVWVDSAPGQGATFYFTLLAIDG
jgi:PAS domain S-box-containing protein